MVKQKMSMSEKIRRQLEQGKSVKEISKYLKCSTGLIYAVRSADKKKAEAKPKAWKTASVSSSAKPVSAQIRADILDTIVANKPGAIRYGETVFVPNTPKDYAVPKRNIVQRFFNWICGG